MSDYAMYTDAGNNAVDAIVCTAKNLQSDWPNVYNELCSLAARCPEEFGEATDTAVRECVYDACGFESAFYI